MSSRAGGRSSANRDGTLGQSMVKRKGLDKKIADDEFMAAAIGDSEWLKQSLRMKKGAITYDKNVSCITFLTHHTPISCDDLGSPYCSAGADLSQRGKYWGTAVSTRVF